MKQKFNIYRRKVKDILHLIGEWILVIGVIYFIWMVSSKTVTNVKQKYLLRRDGVPLRAFVYDIKIYKTRRAGDRYIHFYRYSYDGKIYRNGKKKFSYYGNDSIDILALPYSPVISDFESQVWRGYFTTPFE